MAESHSSTMEPLITANRLTQAVSVVLFSLVGLFTLFIGWYLPRADWGRFNVIRDDGAARLIVELLIVLLFVVLLGVLVGLFYPFLYDLFDVYE
ncbi:hypothetical protein BRC98_02945 [Halobacteriales archaeon QS_7_68_65]|nr:MAG: hypothetical protein BRC98_02945 [Halobacteriales archaeon QS_7_68_65]